MQKRARHAASRTDTSDDLTARDRITHGDERAAQVMADRHEGVTVMHVHPYAAREEISDERHDAAIRYAHCRPFAAGDIESRMPAAPYPVHLTSGAEGARDPCGARTHERPFPQPGHGVRTPRGIA